MNDLLNIASHIYSFIGYGAAIWFSGLYLLDSRNAYCFFPGSVTHTRILESTIKDDADFDKDTEKLCTWASNEYNSSGVSRHWWMEQLTEEMRNIFYSCIWNETIQHMFSQLFNPSEYDIIAVPEMNELYIAGTNNPSSIHSDQVFYTSHIDGPFFWIPFVSVFRCLVALNPNTNIQTCFPMANKYVTLDKGDVLAFDFNREVHYIKQKQQTQQQTKEPRITMKLHYCLYPKGWTSLGIFYARLNAWYNGLFRNLFLRTIQPSGLYDIVSSYMVVYGTHFFVYSDIWLGHKNMIFMGMLYSLYYCQYLRAYHIVAIAFSITIYKHLELYCIDSYGTMKYIEFNTLIRDVYFYFAAGYTSFFLAR